MSTKTKVLVIFAPTASGKTALTRELFSPQGSHFILNAEIISADSQAVYKEMDIGTAKPESQLRAQLPHHLIDAFKSTLEEAVYADLLLLVLDSSDADSETQYETVCSVLEDIGADKNPRLILLNKIDKAEDENHTLQKLRLKFPDAILISAKEEMGFLDLKTKIYELLYGDVADYILPPTQTVLINELKKAGCIEKEEWLDDGVHITARATGRLLALLSPFAK